RADVTLVDCPAGIFGPTLDILSGCTHALGVLQSEMIAQRSSMMLHRGLAAIRPERRPMLLGLVINMFQRRSGPSLEAFHGLCEDGDPQLLFETTIPRSEAFADASLVGQPLRTSEMQTSSPIAWLFDMLAHELCERAGVRPAPEPPTKSFLR